MTARDPNVLSLFLPGRLRRRSDRLATEIRGLMVGDGRKVRFRPETPPGGLHAAGGGRNLESLARLRGGGGAFKGRGRRRADWQPADRGTDRKDSAIGRRPRKFRTRSCC